MDRICSKFGSLVTDTWRQQILKVHSGADVTVLRPVRGERNVGRKVEMDRASKQVDVERLKRNVRVGGWQPEPSMGDSGRGRAPRAALKEVT